MNIWIKDFRNILEKKLFQMLIYFHSMTRARLLSEEENSLLKAAEKFTKMGIKYLIIKKGEHGYMFFK